MTVFDTGPSGAEQDLVQPFKLESSGFHGRLVRLGPAIDAIIGQHSYPAPVATLLAESVALSAALAAALKYDGVFTFQISGAGPVRYLVSDVTSAGVIRAYAGVRGDLPKPCEPKTAPIPQLIGDGYLALTVDQAGKKDRYQGIVDLVGATLTDCVHHYFRQSDQFAAAVRVHADRVSGGGWRAGALMLQMSPESAKSDEQEALADSWPRVLALLGSCANRELTDSAVSVHDLLYRLFHEEGVRVFETTSVKFDCRCSDEKVKRVLGSLSDHALEDLIVDEKVVVTCEFCSRSRVFDREQLNLLRAS
jgi:molecular chaperone Hsp33